MESYKFDGGEVSIIKDNILLVEYNTDQTLTTRNIYNLKKIARKNYG